MTNATIAAYRVATINKIRCADLADNGDELAVAAYGNVYRTFVATSEAAQAAGYTMEALTDLYMDYSGQVWQADAAAYSRRTAQAQVSTRNATRYAKADAAAQRDVKRIISQHHAARKAA